MILELKLRCDTKDDFDAWMKASGLVEVPGVETVELGPIGDDTAFHADVRVASVNAYEREAWLRRGREAPDDLPQDAFEMLTVAGRKSMVGVEVVEPLTPRHMWC
jgi:hypothetical protein